MRIDKFKRGTVLWADSGTRKGGGEDGDTSELSHLRGTRGSVTFLF